MILKTICGALAMLVIATASGCGGREYETISTHPVTGRLTVNGVPAAGAIVRLYPETPQAGAKHPLLPSGRVDQQGTYQLTTYENDDGAPVGDYTVAIEWPDPDWRPPGGGIPPPPPDRLQARFSDPEQSAIEVSVTEGENRLEPIVLEDVEILEGSSLPK